MATEKQPISQYLTAEGKKANTVAMILFEDENSKEKYIFLVEKVQDKKSQLQTPGGKVKVTDAEVELSEEDTYIKAAIREACEEICGDNLENCEKFEVLLNQKKPTYIVNAAERQKLALRAENGHYDTRTICFYLGTQKLETMRALLKTPEPNDTDAIAAYLAPCRSIVEEENGALEVEGKEKKYILSNIGIRITTITILKHCEGVLAKIKQNCPISQSYSRSASPTHFQPIGQKATDNEQGQSKITPKF